MHDFIVHFAVSIVNILVLIMRRLELVAVGYFDGPLDRALGGQHIYRWILTCRGAWDFSAARVLGMCDVEWFFRMEDQLFSATSENADYFPIWLRREILVWEIIFSSRQAWLADWVYVWCVCVSTAFHRWFVHEYHWTAVLVKAVVLAQQFHVGRVLQVVDQVQWHRSEKPLIASCGGFPTVYLIVSQRLTFWTCLVVPCAFGVIHNAYNN